MSLSKSKNKFCNCPHSSVARRVLLVKIKQWLCNLNWLIKIAMYTRYNRANRPNFEEELFTWLSQNVLQFYLWLRSIVSGFQCWIFLMFAWSTKIPLNNGFFLVMKLMHNKGILAKVFQMFEASVCGLLVHSSVLFCNALFVLTQSESTNAVFWK